MTRSPLFLAALASSAVPGLDPVSVEGVPGRPGDLFEIAYVQDSQDRRWVVKCPATQAAGAMLDDIAPLSGLLGRRLDVAMPMVRGFAQVPEGRAAVYLRVPGRPLDFAGLQPGGLAAEVGRTLAHIHNVEHLLFEEAGRPTYDAEAHRRRQLSELDRAAATGHVPTGLLTRWEHALEDVSLWRFAPSAVHGTFTGANVLASFDDEDDSSTGRVRGVLAWEESRIGDPADDFAQLARVAPPETLDAVLEAYAQSRVERPDVHLVRRARLAAEMAPLRPLLHALASGRLEVVERTAERLRALDTRVEAYDRRHARDDAERSERTRAA
ncbi:MAG: phosphotransferase, partial [Dermatophilaceae bacterium]|nr:phosphotransferase [Dermatophilaceae bacterium]